MAEKKAGPKVSEHALEIRASLLLKSDKDAHVKHISFEITNPAACESLVELLAEAIAVEESLNGVKPEDALTLDKVDDAHKFELTGKKKQTAA